MRGTRSLPLALRLGPKKPRDFLGKIEILSDSPVPRMSESWSSLQQYLRYLILFNCFLSIVIIVENSRDGDRSHHVRLSVSTSSQKSASSCSASRISFPILDCVQNSGTWNDCRCIHFRVCEICRYGLAALTTCSRSHLRAI